MSFSLTSPAFDNGEAIPQKYTQNGDNVSPPLTWRDPPKTTKSFALLLEDPDAPHGVVRHWAIYNIDADEVRLPEGVGDGECAQALNDMGHAHYDGPKPPKGDKPHHYHFKLAALDTDRLNLDDDLDAIELWQAIAPHIIAETELVGLYTSP